MNDSKHRKGGWRWARGWISMIPLYAGFGREAEGTEWCLPFKCPSSVQPVREERQCWWQLVTETAGCPTSPCLWSTVRWHLGPKKEKESGKKKKIFDESKQQARRPACANRRPMPRGRPAGMSDNTFSVTAPHYSFFLLPSALLRVFTNQHRGTGGCRLNQVTFPLFHFFHPKFEYEKGLSLTQSKTITLMTFGSHLIY